MMWGALSDERTDLSFTIAAGPHSLSYSRVRVPWDSRPYFTVSDSKLPFSSPPTTRRATVEEFDPASTRGRTESHHVLQFLCYSVFLCLFIPAGTIAQQWIILRLFLAAKPCLPNRCLVKVIFQLVTETCVSEPLAGNGLFRLSDVMSQYVSIS
jgi:hypothetical protein